MTDKQLNTPGGVVQHGPAYINSLYNQYAGMLLGYINEVVKNTTVAEQYLVAVFKDIPFEMDGLSKSGVNTFCYLQGIARKKLSTFFASVDDCAVTDVKQIGIPNSNKFISFMSDEQKLVFCGIYWHGKSVSKIAAELDKTEDAVKRDIKRMFHYYKEKQQMIKEYIDSGILEAYVIGAATEQEEKEVLRMKAKHPEVRETLRQLELDMENVAKHTAIIPPFGTWEKIEREINDLILQPEAKPEKFTREFNYKDKDNGYVEISSTSHMRIHKAWRWVFAAVFVLGKIFLGCAIYFYLENRQAQEQIQTLKNEISHYQK